MANKISLKRLTNLRKSYICKICGTLLPNEAYVAEIHMNHKHPDIKLEGDWFDDSFDNPTIDIIIMIIKQDLNFKKQYNPKCNCFQCQRAKAFYSASFSWFWEIGREK